MLFAPMAVRADTIAIQSSGQSALVYNNVKINNISRGYVAFTTASGNTVKKDLSTVSAMTIDDEPQFNQAQQDFGSGKFDDAVNEYDQTIQSTGKPWLKAYCEPLLTDAANKSGRFDKAVQGYIWLVLNQSGSAAHRPTAPAGGSSYLDGAAQALSDAADTQNLTNDQQAAILGLLLDVQKARNDSHAIDTVASRLRKLNGDTGASGDSNASVALADARLSEASEALGAKNYDQAIAIISGAGNVFVDSRRQADALYIVAQARDGLAQGKDDADVWRDAAIAYMRVVANFKDTPAAPHVADSLLATAAILENHLNQGGKAMKIDQDIQSRWPDTHAADEAGKQLARLQSAGVQPE